MPECESTQSLGPPIVEDELAKRRRFLRGEPGPEGVEAKVLEAPQQQKPKGVQGVQTK